jgi:hypothetical protein
MPAGEQSMLIKIVDMVIEDDLQESAWRLYEEAFQRLRSLAVQRHLMYRAEFDDVMRDSRIQKYLCFSDDGETLLGLSTYTNDLFAMPLIAPEYFERRWPEQYRQGKIWYCGFVAVGSAKPSRSAFAELVEAMYRMAANQDGIIALDFCRYNDQLRNMSRVIQLMLHRLSGGVQAECMDQQSFWVYEFPAAA